LLGARSGRGAHEARPYENSHARLFAPIRGHPVRALSPFEDFDQTGIEWPKPPQERADGAHARLFADDYAQAGALDRAPVFGTGDRALTAPADDYVQPAADY